MPRSPYLNYSMPHMLCLCVYAFNYSQCLWTGGRVIIWCNPICQSYRKLCFRNKIIRVWFKTVLWLHCCLKYLSFPQTPQIKRVAIPGDELMTWQSFSPGLFFYVYIKSPNLKSCLCQTRSGIENDVISPLWANLTKFENIHIVYLTIVASTFGYAGSIWCSKLQKVGWSELHNYILLLNTDEEFIPNLQMFWLYTTLHIIHNNYPKLNFHKTYALLIIKFLSTV